jgi:long-chain acyl-CoA synthetase
MTETLVHLIESAAAEFPDAPALEGEGEGGGRVCLSRTDLLRRAAALAGRLIEAGLGPGDSAALLSPNRAEWAVGYFAVLLAGGVLVPLDVNLKRGEWANILERSKVAALLTDVSREEDARALAEGLPGSIPRFRIDEAAETEAFPLSRWPGAERGPDDLALISFSSGTTGVPKGVMLTHGNIASNAQAAASLFLSGEEDVFLSILPLHHMFESTAGLLLPLIAGAKVHYLASLNPRVISESMRREGVTVCIMVPALARLMHRRIISAALGGSFLRTAAFRVLFALSKAALGAGIRIGGLVFPQVKQRLGPRLRFFFSGGAALDPVICRDMLALGIEIIQGYGLTETSPITHANRPGGGNRIGTVGPPLPGVEVRLSPAEGGNPGEGEILIRGPNVMKGYFGNPGLTAEVLREGWFHTGDIGRVDGEGYLTICGRSKNVIVAESGKNIYPEEVEEELAASPLFSAACVIGKKNPRGGEEVFAVLVLHPEAELPDPEEERRQAIRGEIARLSSRLADYKRVSDFFVWPGGELPQTTTLKVKREEIKAALREMLGFGPEDF